MHRLAIVFHQGCTTSCGKCKGPPRAALGLEQILAKMVKKGDLPRKTCAHCGLPMVWRKKWEKVWDEVRYCSDRCRNAAKGGKP